MTKQRIFVAALAAIITFVTLLLLIIGSRKSRPNGSGLTFVREAAYAKQA